MCTLHAVIFYPNIPCLIKIIVSPSINLKDKSYKNMEHSFIMAFLQILFIRYILARFTLTEKVIKVFFFYYYYFFSGTSIGSDSLGLCVQYYLNIWSQSQNECIIWLVTTKGCNQVNHRIVYNWPPKLLQFTLYILIYFIVSTKLLVSTVKDIALLININVHQISF